MLNLCFVQLARCRIPRGRQPDIWARRGVQKGEVGICWPHTQIVRGRPTRLASCLRRRMDGGMDGGMDGRTDGCWDRWKKDRTDSTVRKIPWPRQPGSGRASAPNPTVNWSKSKIHEARTSGRANKTRTRLKSLVKAAFIGRYQPGIRQRPHFCF